MNKKWTILIAALVILGFLSTKFLFKKSDSQKTGAFAKSEGAIYWTCPMHPQIHNDKAGECPICHMKLVQVKEQMSQANQTDEMESRSHVVASPYQLQLLGVQKLPVEKMNLTAHIPVSGRLISASTVAFQVYESDLRYVKPGLAFTGESSFFPESDIKGIVASVDSIMDPTSRTVRVVGTIRSGPRGLVSETTFRGDLSIDLKDVIGIPESSVLQTGNGSLVYVVMDDNSLMAQPVKLGLKTESYYEVLEGVSPGQSISSGPNFLIDSEAKIRGTGSGHSHH